MNKWVYIKLALIATGVVLMFLAGPVGKASAPPMDTETLFIVLLGSAFGLQFVIGIQSINKWSAKTWTKPSWKKNPFNLKQPLQFFHFAAYFFLIGGTIQFIYTFLINSSVVYEAAVGPIMGVGLLLGVRLSVLIFAFKFRTTEDNKT